MAHALDSPAMSIYGLEMPRNLAKLDNHPSPLRFDEGQQILSSPATIMDKATPISVHRDDRNDLSNNSPLHSHGH